MVGVHSEGALLMLSRSVDEEDDGLGLAVPFWGDAECFVYVLGTRFVLSFMALVIAPIVFVLS